MVCMSTHADKERTMLAAPSLQHATTAPERQFSLLKRWLSALLRPHPPATPRLDPDMLNEHLRRDMGFTDGRPRRPGEPSWY